MYLPYAPSCSDTGLYLPCRLGCNFTRITGSTQDWGLRHLLPTIRLILLVDKRVSHPRNVIADDARQRLLSGFFAVVARQIIGLLHPVGKEFAGNALGVFFLARQRRAVIEIFVKKVFQPA